jgi:hypothetical protein
MTLKGVSRRGRHPRTPPPPRTRCVDKATLDRIRQDEAPARPPGTVSGSIDNRPASPGTTIDRPRRWAHVVPDPSSGWQLGAKERSHSCAAAVPATDSDVALHKHSRRGLLWTWSVLSVGKERVRGGRPNVRGRRTCDRGRPERSSRKWMHGARESGVGGRRVKAY